MTARRPGDCLYYLLSRATLSATAALRRCFEEAGVGEVKPAYLGVLLSLWQEDGQKTTELGRRAGLEPSTMTGLLDRMERDALIERVADPDDRRAQRVRLTPRGKAVEARAREIVDEMLARVTRGIGVAEIDRLKHTLRRLLANARGPEEEAR
ncbi:MAG: MarR family transcriptional regulator [Deltaproteobacteria bacterium]|nr:MarR family transcriptional regulator [Deltaproteobacteria bacterium]